MTAMKRGKAKTANSKTAKREQSRPPGRPTKFCEQRCQDIIDHMENGGTIAAFGAYVGKKYGKDQAICEDTVYEWAASIPEFSEALKVAKSYSSSYWDELGRAGMTGNMRRIKSEKPIIIDGKAMLDPQGQVIKNYEYEPANFNASAWIFLRKNCHGWTDKLQHSGEIGGGNPIRKSMDKIMDDPKLAAYAREIAERMSDEE